jgi:hypothetical protein
MTPEDNSKAFVKLVTANGLPEADVWKAVLEASGIQVFLRHEAMAAVPREQAAEALQILQDERVEPTDEDEPV